ncbi:unnamed protein product [Allacma fusca]|uniref:Terpene synthase n=1 Tax=Allacma fusca TaxID=39272 RepID=A0A8J2JNM3_9HEXA|nr:unnamed protein product [Allacma fusca]
MDIADDFKLLKLEGVIKVANGEEKIIDGDLVFCWPYKWEPDLNIWQDLVNKMAEDVFKYVNRRLSFKEKSRPLSLIKDSLWMGLFNISKSWREASLENEEIYHKLVLFGSYFYMLYILDDVAEKLDGNSGHGRYVKNVGRLLQKLFMLEYPNINSINEDNLFLNIKSAVGFREEYIYVMFDIIEDLKTYPFVTPPTMKYLARCLRYGFELQTWFGSYKNSHILESSLRSELRSRIIGLDALVEFLLVIYEIPPALKVRENFYWDRIYRTGRTLGYKLNDILSIRKELEEYLKDGTRIDNAILIAMENKNMSFEKAMEIEIQEHNALVVEFRNECQGILAEPGIMFDMNDQEREIFVRSLECITTTLSHLIQTHLKMVRYKANITYSFSDKTDEAKHMLNFK